MNLTFGLCGAPDMLGDFVQTDPIATYAQHPQWPEVVLRFNLGMAGYAHSSWLPAGLPASLDGSRGYRAALSAGLLDEISADGLYDWSMELAATRLFLMDSDSLAKLALVVGIASHRRSLRQVVQGPQIEMLRAALDDSLHALWSPLAQAVPDAETALVLPWNLPPNSGTQAFRTILIGEGHRQLLRLVDPGDPRQRAGAVRAALCLNKSMAEEALPSLSAVQAQTMTDALIEHAVKQWTPQWTWLF